MEKETNVATLVGVVRTDPTFHHKDHYMVKVATKRLSGTEDEIPVVFPEEVLEKFGEEWAGNLIRIKGEYISHNKRIWKQFRNKLLLYINANEIEFLSIGDEIVHEDKVHMIGTICKIPIYRKTPLGREITDLMIAVEDSRGKSSYIPCLTWGKEAQAAAEYEVGNCVEIKGRIQSRGYSKEINDHESVSLIAYEISVSEINLVDSIPREKKNTSTSR